MTQDRGPLSAHIDEARMAAKEGKIAAAIDALSEAEAKKLLLSLLNPAALTAQDANERTPLLRAILDRDALTVSFLSEITPSLLVVPIDSRAPLLHAATAGDEQICRIMVESLMKHKSELDSSSIEWGVHTALLCAVKQGNEPITRMLWPLWQMPRQALASKYLFDHPLDVAIQHAQWNLFSIILSQADTRTINLRDPEGAGFAHRLLSVEKRLRSDARQQNEDSGGAKSNEAINAFFSLAGRSDWDSENAGTEKTPGLSPLFAAIESGCIEAVRFLIPRTDVNALRSAKGRKRPLFGNAAHGEMHTALSFAIDHGNAAALNLLLPLSASSMAQRQIRWQYDDKKFTPLDVALKAEQWECAAILARELIEKNALTSDERENTERELSRARSQLPKEWQGFEAQFRAAQEAFELRQALSESRLSSAAGSAELSEPQDAKPARRL